MKRFLAILTVLAVVLVAFAACGGGQGETPSGATAMTMGTGGTQGTYYAYGGILGNQIKSATGITTNVVSTDGSKANILGIDVGNYQLGTVQSDVMAYAYAGTRNYQRPILPSRALEQSNWLGMVPFSSRIRQMSGVISSAT